MLYDVIILGGGPAGYSAAEKAAMNGLKTLLIEKNTLGGVCLNEGCIPTKTLLYSAKVFDYANHADKYGINANAEGADLKKIIVRKTKVVRKLVAGVKGKMREAGVEVLDKEATVKGVNADGTITLIAENEELICKNLLIATGSETFVPPIKGVENTDFWTSREALNAKEAPKKIAIIGGGVIGMEFASFYNSIGVDVTVIEMLPEIINGMDPELAAQLRAIYEKKGIKFMLRHKVCAVSNEGVEVEFEGATSFIEADRILMSVGRRPVTSSFDSLQLEMKGRGVAVDEFMRTSQKGVYAAGDVTGFSLLAHTAIREAEVAINHILGKEDDKMSYNAVPAVVYTNPEIAGVGYTEEKLKSEGIAYKVLQKPMAFAGRFIAENEGVNGVCKILVSEDNHILGCHMLGNPSSEIIIVATMAIQSGMKGDELLRIIFPHPTVGEIVRETLIH
ncbi:dihydrolipoyl dehydrogenase [Falsiporphyromonas endometrii]|uniref:Dihydrolipoyl dehydrogenase n=1 Tax=Falsiporphyromonas endometrii TaxID=1387297 RepID=A0ABV9K8Q2_9PORP